MPLFGFLLFACSNAAAKDVDYRRDIEPILAAKCFSCHGSKRQESGLRLDVRSRALAGGDSGRAIVAGKSGASPLVQRVTSRGDDRMPPEGERLTEPEVARLRAWIDQGAAGIPDVAESHDHWAFQPIASPIPPRVTGDWPRNAIDAFILDELRSREVVPSPEAARATLIRRVYLDLIGLLPDWDRVQSFVTDPRPDAFERLVDELLASSHYGERWGRHWLDVARYADSTGYESDQPREIWAYRDWVIDALNADMPFDQFVIEQLAGDLLPDATIDQRIATGFHCNAMLDPGVRWENVLDRVNATGAVFLGLTTGCAQCHSHKTDPLTHREFYQLYAFFNDATIDTMRLDGKPLAPPADTHRDGNDGPVEQPPTTLVMKRTPQPTHVFVRGDPRNPGDPVQPDFPSFLPQSETTEPATRLDLARWLVSRDNPLTARVNANRVWQRFFGTGLVETEADFGVQTKEPRYVELLDYLANELRGSREFRASTAPGANDEWRGLKSLHRLIVTSATYRQSSHSRTDLAETDPTNALFARQRRLRLEAEIIRDISLDASGLLSTKRGGPSVFPHQPDGILDARATPAEWTMSTGEDRYRRGLYTWVWRLTPHPHLPLFDAPDGVTACTQRDRSNVPVQALTLLNDPTFVEMALAMAADIERSSNDDDERLRRAFRTCLSRDPVKVELDIAHELLEQQRRSPASERTSWTVVCRTLLNLDEFMTRE